MKMASVAGHAEVAGQREFQASADAVTLDGGDDRFRAAGDPVLGGEIQCHIVLFGLTRELADLGEIRARSRTPGPHRR